MSKSSSFNAAKSTVYAITDKVRFTAKGIERLGIADTEYGISEIIEVDKSNRSDVQHTQWLVLEGLKDQRYSGYWLRKA